MMKTTPLNNMSWRAWLAAALAAVTLAACGGGGGGGETTGTSSVVILDSFGNDVGGDGSSGVGVGDSGADGTAGEGAAIVGGRVEITDVNGKSVTATTDAQGYYRVKVTGFTPPFVAKVTKTDGKVLHSLNVTPLKVNGFVTVNITGLTDKIASDVAVAAGRAGAAQLTPQLVAANTGAITTAVNNLREQLAPVISAAGLNTSTFDPLGAPFRPNLQGYDLVLENVVVTVGSDGKTQVTVSSTFVQPLAGNWQLHLNYGDGDVAVGTPLPASAVPSAQMLSQFNTADAASYILPTAAVSGGNTVTVNGNVVTVTGPGTNLTLTLHGFTYSGYQSCGGCGVGSQVSFVLNAHYTESGTIDGQIQPTFTSDFTVTFKYVRVS